MGDHFSRSSGAGTAEQDLPSSLLSLVARHREALRVHYTPNIGPQRKLIPMLRLIQDEGTSESVAIVTADDDALYPAWWLATMLRVVCNCFEIVHDSDDAFDDYAVSPSLSYRAEYQAVEISYTIRKPTPAP